VEWKGRKRRGGKEFAAPTVMTFSHSGKPTGIVITSHDSLLPKTSSWMENCTKVGQLILSNITKIVATSCEIFRPNSISARAPPQTLLGELTALPQTP